jgi:hypothetical protein
MMATQPPLCLLPMPPTLCLLPMPPTTVLDAVQPHFSLFQDTDDIQLVAQMEKKYCAHLKKAKQREKEALTKQEHAVAIAVKAGKNKRDIRKLKNRLSAIRSRARKEAETTLSETRIRSLESQIRMYVNFVERLKKSNDEKKNRLLSPTVDKRLQRLPLLREPFSLSTFPTNPSSPLPFPSRPSSGSSFSCTSSSSSFVPNSSPAAAYNCNKPTQLSNQTSFDSDHSSKVVFNVVSNI